MERIVNQRYAELIAYAIDAVPVKIRQLILPVHFLTGTDPYYAGLELPDGEETLYKNAMHYTPVDCQSHLPKSMRYTTIVIPDIHVTPGDIVHELGHVLDERTMWYTYRTNCTPVTEYAETCFEEAFAEAFGAWLFYDYGNIRAIDEETLALFQRLSGTRIN